MSSRGLKRIVCLMRGHGAWIDAGDHMGALCGRCGTPAIPQSCHCWRHPCTCGSGRPMTFLGDRA